MKNRISFKLLAGVLCLSTFCGISAAAADTDRLLDTMTREEKAGQMLMAAPSQLCQGDWTENVQQVLQTIDLYHIGSVIFFAEDLEHPDAVKELTDALAAREDMIGILTVADRSGSITGGLTKPDNDTTLTVGPFAYGAEDTWCYGITGAPDADLSELGILLDGSAGAAADFAVVTHAKVNGDSDMDAGRPASMARSLVQNTLKTEFDGVVLTDSLSMEAATQPYGADMAVQYALQAGNTILTAPSNLMTAYYGILSAMDEQLVSEEQINDSVQRILTAKEGLGLIS